MTYKEVADFFREELKGGKCSDDCLSYNAMIVAIEACDKIAKQEEIVDRLNAIGCMSYIGQKY